MDILQLVASNVPATQTVSYSCTLTNTWSGATHPIDYASVSGTAHWTAPVLLSHSRMYEIWSPGSPASPGAEALAETGATALLAQEIEAERRTRRTIGELVVGRDQFNASDPPQRFEPITMGPSYPVLSTMSMAGPSPDWFTGIYNFRPVDSQNFWYESFEVATYPYDAGTEQGTTYSISNDPEVPHRTIFRLTLETVPDNGILLDPTGTEVLPMAVWSCSLDGDSSGSRSLLKAESPSQAPSIGDRNLLKAESPSQAPSIGDRNLLKAESPSEAPSAGDRNLLVLDYSEAPSFSTRGLAKQVPTEVPTISTPNLLKVEASSEAPSVSDRNLLVQDYTESPTSSNRGLAKQATTESPTISTRNLLKIEASSEAPSVSDRNLSIQDYTDAPSTGIRGLAKQAPTEAPSTGIRGLAKQAGTEAPTTTTQNLAKTQVSSNAPSTRGLRGSRN